MKLIETIKELFKGKENNYSSEMKTYYEIYESNIKNKFCISCAFSTGSLDKLDEQCKQCFTTMGKINYKPIGFITFIEKEFHYGK